MTQTTSQRIGLTVAPDRLQLVPGGRVEVTLVVTNQGPVVDTFDLVVEGVDPSWFTVTTASVSLFPGITDSLGLEVHLPGGDETTGGPQPFDGPALPGAPASPTVAAGHYQVTLRVTSRDDATSTTASLDLEVLPIGTLALDLIPQRQTLRGLGARGAWGRYRLRLHNRSNAERLVDIAVTDDEAALESRLDADRLAIPPGETREVAISLRLKRRRAIAPPRSVPFTVSLTVATGENVVVPGTGEPGEVLGSTYGELVYIAPFAFLAGLPLWLQRLLPLLLALLVLLLVLSWLLGGRGMQLPFQARPTAVVQLSPSPSGTTAPATQTTAAAQQTAAAATAAAAASTGTQTSAQQTATAAGQLPVIGAFELRTPAGGGRGEFELAWDVQRADQVRILDVRAGQKTPLGGVPNTPTGNLRVQTQEDREFELEATNRVGTVRRSLGVVILRPPEIAAFSADQVEIDPGQPVVLTWEVRRAARIGLAGRPEDLGAPQNGSITVQPDATTTFTLVAVNDLGRDERSVTVRVR